MKKSINAWSIPGDVDFETMFSQIKKAGFDGIELNVDAPGRGAHSLHVGMSDAELSAIRAVSKKYDLPIGSVSTSLWGGSMASTDETVRENGKTLLREQLRIADALGADGILIVPGGVSGNLSLLGAWENCLKFMKEMKPEIAESGIFTGVENVWAEFFLSPFDMARFIDEIDCPNLGAYFDVGNVAVDTPPEHWIEILGNRIGKIHVKDFQNSHGKNTGWFVNLLEGSINWRAVIPALRKAGYDGYLTAELGVIGQCPEFLYDITNLALERMIHF